MFNNQTRAEDLFPLLLLIKEEKMILAIGNSGVNEINAFQLVFQALKKKGHEAVLFKQDRCLVDNFMTFSVSRGQVRYFVAIDGNEYDASQFDCIWYLKPHLPKEIMASTDPKYFQLVERQFLAMRQAMWSIFRDKKWISDPWSMQIAENKIFQLQLAARCGFDLPDTIITSEPESVRQFYLSHHGQIVVKLLASSPILDHVIYTNRVTEEYFQKIESVKYSPSIFQEIVPKQYELRITVVGDKIFPVKINSQDDADTSLDWRRKPKLNDFQVKMEQTTIPDNISDAILNYMKSLDLRFGCIDMIVTPEGQYIFLEINPNGQWYFVQLRTEAKIAEAIADLFT